ncbi:hypothetical protein LWI29_016934 [Acer saccharum]|uniref:Uncharacterized protein n=1 Tax=Acer saccharum TaxID=4024 RepID=A0AA39SWZ2_ACESA|nr:hypothetical protein LWI29_016934 [Acer saccharum]
MSFLPVNGGGDRRFTSDSRAVKQKSVVENGDISVSHDASTSRGFPMQVQVHDGLLRVVGNTATHMEVGSLPAVRGTDQPAVEVETLMVNGTESRGINEGKLMEDTCSTSTVGKGIPYSGPDPLDPVVSVQEIGSEVKAQSIPQLPGSSGGPTSGPNEDVSVVIPPPSPSAAFGLSGQNCTSLDPPVGSGHFGEKRYKSLRKTIVKGISKNSLFKRGKRKSEVESSVFNRRSSKFRKVVASNDEQAEGHEGVVSPGVTNGVGLPAKEGHAGVVSTGVTKDQQKKQQRPKRVASLDIFKGLTVALMILVDDAGGDWPVIGHAPWNGCNLADFVMPSLHCCLLHFTLSQENIKPN